MGYRRRYTGVLRAGAVAEEVSVAEVSSHSPGSFCWVELSTSDQMAGAKFYSALFGWDINEQSIGTNEPTCF